MGKSVNKVILVGNVGKDPEVRTTASGTTVVNFSIATTDRAKDASGDWTDRTEWHSLVAFQRTAEVIRDYVRKGTKVYVEGKLQTRSWDDRESGQKKYKTEVLVNELVLLSNREGGEQSQPSIYQKSAPAAQKTEEFDPFDDDPDAIPF